MNNLQFFENFSSEDVLVSRIKDLEYMITDENLELRFTSSKLASSGVFRMFILENGHRPNRDITKEDWYSEFIDRVGEIIQNNGYKFSFFDSFNTHILYVMRDI